MSLMWRTDLKTLQNVLQNPKQRGVFGEYYLSSVLENILAPGQYQTQYKFRDGEMVDAVIFLDRVRFYQLIANLASKITTG